MYNNNSVDFAACHKPAHNMSHDPDLYRLCQQHNLIVTGGHFLMFVNDR